jgi:hypothetical protein
MIETEFRKMEYLKSKAAEYANLAVQIRAAGEGEEAILLLRLNRLMSSMRREFSVLSEDYNEFLRLAAAQVAKLEAEDAN